MRTLAHHHCKAPLKVCPARGPWRMENPVQPTSVYPYPYLAASRYALKPFGSCWLMQQPCHDCRCAERPQAGPRDGEERRTVEQRKDAFLA